MNSLPPDHQVREEVLDPARSFIVEAPAGSGKTELLIQRYLKLLATVDEPESVLAITFTRKAAGEMRHRVIQALSAADRDKAGSSEHELRTRALANEVLNQDRRRGWSLLQNPERLQIRTIDSFCDSLVRRLPWVAQFGAMPAVVEDASALYDQAAQATIELLGAEGRSAQAVAELLRRLDNNIRQAQELLVTMLACRDQWLRHTANANAGEMRQLRRALEAALESAVRLELAAMLKVAPKEIMRELLPLCRFAASNVPPNDPLYPLIDITDLPAVGVHDLKRWRALRELLLTDKGELRKKLDKNNGFPAGIFERDKKDQAMAILERLGQERYQPFVAALSRLSFIPDPAYTDEEWRFMEALLHVLPLACAQLREVFRSAGQVDFAEVTQAALLALRENSKAAVELASSAPLKHLLVDEYQDTSVTQQELLRRLVATWKKGDGRTLFLVGDPKQSIYGFRQAEVALFQQAQHGAMQQLELCPRSLEANFRSQSGLVDWVNSTFRSVLDQEDIARGAVGFGKNAVAVHKRLEGDAAEIIPVGDAADGTEAQHVREIIERECAADPEAKIAILVRSRNHLNEVVQELNAAGIAFRAVDIDPLGSRQIVRDLDALARALAHPGDRTAWLAILRAPWCGLELSDLCALFENSPGRTTWELIQERVDRLSEPGQIRLKRLCSILSPMLEQRGRSGLRNLVESAWNALGGPACLPKGKESDLQLSAAMSYLRLLEESESGGDWLDRAQFEKRLEQLHAPAAPAKDVQVELMTIHRAKGLEFDIVIVPGLHRQLAADDRQLLYWREWSPGGSPELMLAPLQHSKDKNKRSITAYLRRFLKEREEQEERRVLYVATTRAKRRLYLLGKSGKVDLRSLLHKLCAAPEIRTRFTETTASSEHVAAMEQPTREPRRLKRLALAWQTPSPPEAVRWKPIFASPADETVHTFEWASDRLRHVGTVVHQYLKQIALDGLERWDEKRISAAGPAIRSALFQLGVVQDLDTSIKDAQTALRQMLGDEKGRWILGPQREAQNELEISGVVGGQLYHLRVDRTFVDDAGVRWVIDYKIARHEGGSVEDFLDAQREKYRPDLERYGRLLAAMDPRPVRLALYFPLLSAWRELEAAATRADQEL
jgi:ATP-dependent exoDNAse (exonuclease V) beta subunit